MSFDFQDNLREQAVSRLTSMYSDRPNVVALITAIASRSQIVEDALYGLATKQLYANAEGQQLDDIGALVGVDRNNLPDAQYRLLIQGQIAENSGDASLTTLLTIMSSLWETSSVFVRTPNSINNGPLQASAWVAAGIGSAQLPKSLDDLAVSIVRKAISAGVNFAYLAKYDATEAFCFAGTQGAGKGFGSIKDPSAGGMFAQLAYPHTSV